MLTGEGEQLLGDCRALLNYASALGERAQLLRRGDTGVLKVATSPQIIESVLLISCTSTPTDIPMCR